MALTRLGPNQSVNLASNVTGTLPTGNGGTGATSFNPSSLVKLSTVTTSSTPTTIEFTGLDTSTYGSYMFQVQNLVFGSSQNLNMQFGTSSAYVTSSGYSTVWEDLGSRSTYTDSASQRGPNSMGNGFSGTFWILPALNTTIESAQRGLFGHYMGMQRSNGDRAGMWVIEDTSLAGTAFAKFKMFGSSGGTFEDGGVVTLYGILK